MTLIVGFEILKKAVRNIGLSDEFTVFAVWIMRGWENGNKEVFELAKKNPAVHIFYCKNFLGMTDKQDVTTTIDAKDNFIEALTASASTDWNDYGGDV